MTLASINQAAADPQLIARVNSCVQQEARNNAELSGTAFAKQIVTFNTSIQPLVWAVAVATEAAYYAALQNGRGAPGHDTDIITDGDITAAVQANWPPDPEPIP